MQSHVLIVFIQISHQMQWTRIK